VINGTTLDILVAPVFATNCCIVSSPSGDTLIVDPGAGITVKVLELVTQKRLNVKGVAATHGHADHTWDAGRLANHYEVPFFIHQDDAYRIADPIGTLRSPGTRPDQSVAVAISSMVRAYGVGGFEEPHDLQALPVDTGRLVLGELVLDLIAAPGHTEGSTLFRTDDFLLTGDVLFAGSIGRTDLPGGDLTQMHRTLAMIASSFSYALRVIPGHGPESTIGAELATNPYLRG
jgi:glyoxylase-like metal-dependent hydrolase (beta-lactamase superfamily II)